MFCSAAGATGWAPVVERGNDSTLNFATRVEPLTTQTTAPAALQEV
jgi:hypothetical protein